MKYIVTLLLVSIFWLQAYSEDPNKSYYGYDAEACEAMDFSCSAPWVWFTDEKWCGCELTTEVEVCSNEYEPVCGMPYFECDWDAWMLCAVPMSMTFDNICILNREKGTFEHEGACEYDYEKSLLPEDTSSKYYVWNTEKCQRIRYACEDAWSGFTDEIWCGCEKDIHLSSEVQNRLNTLVENFLTQLWEKYNSEEQQNEIIGLAIDKLTELMDNRPQYTNEISYIIIRLEQGLN